MCRIVMFRKWLVCLLLLFMYSTVISVFSYWIISLHSTCIINFVLRLIWNTNILTNYVFCLTQRTVYSDTDDFTCYGYLQLCPSCGRGLSSQHLGRWRHCDSSCQSWPTTSYSRMTSRVCADCPGCRSCPCPGSATASSCMWQGGHRTEDWDWGLQA